MRILDLHTVGGHGRFAHAGLVLGKNSELVLSVLDEAGDVDHVGDAERVVDAGPVLRALLSLLHPVTLDLTAAVRLGFLPRKTGKVSADLGHIWHPWGIRSIWWDGMTGLL